MATICLAHVKAWNPATSSETTLYFSTAGYITGTANLPPGGTAHTYYEPRIQQPALMRRDCWQRGTTGGESSVGYGTLDLVNADGGLDYLLDWGLDGRRVTIIIGEVLPGGVPTWTVALTGTMAPPEITRNQVKLRLRDRQAELDKPVCANAYAGNNSLPNGLEGTANDLKGKRKPRIYGRVCNISPPCVNTTRLIYQVNDGAILTVDAVYDRGATITKGADYTSQSDMETNVPAAGTYRVWPAGGYFRLGSVPAGQLTCDATQGATAAARTSAQIVNAIATGPGGLAVGDISSADISALDALQSAEIGLWFGDAATCRAALDLACNAVGAWWGFDRLGVLRIARFDAPSGQPVATLTEGEILRIERLNTDDGGVPAWKLTLSYKRNWVAQNSDIAGSVTADRRAVIAESWRKIETSDASVKTARPLAKEIEIQSDLIDATAAATEAARLFALYKVQRHRYEVRSALDASLISSIDLGAVVRLQQSRFGMGSGKDFRVIGISPDLRTRTAALTLWR